MSCGGLEKSGYDRRVLRKPPVELTLPPEGPTEIPPGAPLGLSAVKWATDRGRLVQCVERFEALNGFYEERDTAILED